MGREMPLNDLKADPTLLPRGLGAEQTTIIGVGGDVIASVPHASSRPAPYENLEDVLTGIEADETGRRRAYPDRLNWPSSLRGRR